jgi:hypothetical protein
MDLTDPTDLHGINLFNSNNYNLLFNGYIFLEKGVIIFYILLEIHKKFFNLNYSPPQRRKGIKRHKVFSLERLN